MAFIGDNSRSVRARRAPQLSARQGSVLILVIAVLVLLALMGTAYIATSRSERVTARNSETRATVDTFAQGVLGSVRSALQKDANPAKAVGDATNPGDPVVYIPSFAVTPTAPGLFSLPILASRAPVAYGNVPGDRLTYPVWPAISAPLDAVPYGEWVRYPLPFAYGFPNYNNNSVPNYLPYTERTRTTQNVSPEGPAGAPLASTRSGAFFSPIYNLATATGRVLSDFPSGGAPSATSMLVNSTDGQWGQTEIARRNLLIGWITVDGVKYPAFVATDPATGGDTWVIAADADGDGIADSGLNRLGTLPNPELDGITFYAGVRVVDNNSAINVNTAWSYTADWTFDGSGDDANGIFQPGEIRRNNRFFPTSIGLRETLAPADFAGTTSLDILGRNGVDEFYIGKGYTWGGGFKHGFQLYRFGRQPAYDFGTDTAQPIREYDRTSFASLFPPAAISSTAFRNDYVFATQQEQFWFQLGRRIDFPGMWAGPGATTGQRFNTFSLSDQAQLAYGFVLAPVDNNSIPTSNAQYIASLFARDQVTQLLPWSTYRIPFLNIDEANRWKKWRSTPTAAYAVDAVGSADLDPVATINAKPIWYLDNFNFTIEPMLDSGGALTGAAKNNTLPMQNLRPFLVARNPVSQAAPFKPLPVAATTSTAIGSAISVGASVAYDVMNPYVQPYRIDQAYLPGDFVYYNKKYYYLSGTAPRYQVAPGSASSPWVEWTKPVSSIKVNVNKAPFGDLWRGYFGVMSSDKAVRASLQVEQFSRDTMSPFGPTFKLSATDVANELYRGMSFTTPLTVGVDTTDPVGGAPVPPNAASVAPPSIVTAPLTYHPQRMFRSNVKDYVTGAVASAQYTTVTPNSMVALRSAQAAVNAEYLRSMNATDTATTNANSTTTALPQRDDIVRRLIPILATLNGKDDQPVMAQVYSAGKFPYITEVYANTEGGSTVAISATVGGSTIASQTRPGGYVAVELYNPYPFAISLANFKIQRVLRPATTPILPGPPNGTPSTTDGRTLEDLFTFPDTPSDTAIQIPPGGFVVLENYPGAAASPADATTPTPTVAASPASARPTSALLAGSPKTIYIPRLEACIASSVQASGAELVIARPILANVVDPGGGGPKVLYALPPTGSTDPRVAASNLVDNTRVGFETPEYYAPFDSIDLTGTEYDNAPLDDAAQYRRFGYAYHYARKTSDWKFVYPGRYDGRAASPLRQQGLRRYHYIAIDVLKSAGPTAVANDDTPMLNPAVVLGGRNGTTGTAADPTAELATYAENFPIQISNWGFGGANATIADNINGFVSRFPLGGFARLGDLLQVPYISPVKIRLPAAHQAVATPKYIDVISLTADAAFAEDTDTYDNAEENIGRFTPIITPTPIIAIPTGTQHPATNGADPRAQVLDTTNFPLPIDEFALNPVTYTFGSDSGTAGFYDALLVRYGWANRLFDFVAVSSPADLSMPDAETYKQPTARTIWDVANYPNQNGTFNDIPQPVAASPSNFQPRVTLAQAGAGIDGLVNINTAPLPVLAAVPWVRTYNPALNTQTDINDPAIDRDMNLRIAQAIIDYREPRVGRYDSANQGKPLPFRPFRSLFELNKVLISAYRSASGGTHDGVPDYVDGAGKALGSFRTGGNLRNGQPFFGTSNTEPTGAWTTPVTGILPAFKTVDFLTPDNGFFMPAYEAISAATGDPRFPLITPDTDTNRQLPGFMATTGKTAAQPWGTGAQTPTAANYTAGQWNDRTVINDFTAQFLMMTNVSNLITVRSDTFTAYIVIEGWKNAGSTDINKKPERVSQKRFAYIIDRSGSSTSLPIDIQGKEFPDTRSGIFGAAATVASPEPVKAYPIPAAGQ